MAAGRDGEAFLYTTNRGLTIGIYTAYHIGKAVICQSITSLQEQGAQVIVAAFHMGTEGSYIPTSRQKGAVSVRRGVRRTDRIQRPPPCAPFHGAHGQQCDFVQRGEFMLRRESESLGQGHRRGTDWGGGAGGRHGTPDECDRCSLLRQQPHRPQRLPPIPYNPDSKEAARVRSKPEGTYQPPTATAPAQLSGRQWRRYPCRTAFQRRSRPLLTARRGLRASSPPCRHRKAPVASASSTHRGSLSS